MIINKSFSDNEYRFCCLIVILLIWVIPISSLNWFFSIMLLLEFMICFNIDNFSRLIVTDLNHFLIFFLSSFIWSTISSDLFHNFDLFLNHIDLRITRVLSIELRDLLFVWFSIKIRISLFQHIFTRTFCLTKLIVFLVPIKLDFFLLVLLLLREICAFVTYRTFAPKLLTKISLKPFLILAVIGSLDINVMLHAFL